MGGVYIRDGFGSRAKIRSGWPGRVFDEPPPGRQNPMPTVSLERAVAVGTPLQRELGAALSEGDSFLTLMGPEAGGERLVNHG
jgi:hypothetical protein